MFIFLDILWLLILFRNLFELFYLCAHFKLDLLNALQHAGNLAFVLSILRILLVTENVLKISFLEK